MLGFVSVAFAQDGVTPEADYDAIIATFAGFAGGIVLLVEGIKKLFPQDVRYLDAACELAYRYCCRDAPVVA